MIEPRVAGAGFDPAPPVQPNHDARWRMYLLAILYFVAAMALPAAVEPPGGSQHSLITLLLFALAVALATSAGGLRGGIVFLLLGAAWFIIVTLPRVPELSIAAKSVSVALYVLSAGGSALLVAAHRRARLQAEAEAEAVRLELEQRVLDASRTTEEGAWAGERYRTPADDAADTAIFMLTPEGRHATWNKGVGRMLGYEKLEFLRGSPEDLFIPDDRAQGLPARELAEALERGRISAERWMIRKDGTWLPVLATISSVLNQKGKLLGFSKRLRDLSAVKRIEDELLRHQEALELGYEAAGLGTWDHDLISGELRLDQRATLMFGFHPGDPVTYDNWADAVHSEDLEPMEELRGTAIRDHQPFSSQFRVLWPDGTTHWLAAMGRGSYDKATGKPLRMRGILLDVTERKQTEERMQEVVRLESIGRLAGGIAHDLNNMLVAIMGFSDLLGRSLEPDDPRLEDVEQITRAATQSATLTQQLLAFARRELIQPRSLDLNRLVRFAAGMLRPVVGENIQLVVKLSPTVGGIHADPPRVEQIVMNLVLNARDAMPQGGRVEVETSALDVDEGDPKWQTEAEAPPPGRYAVLKISDTGHGMDAGTLKHIWEPFFTTKPAGQGTGLGLSVVYGSVKQSGGFVTVESEVDKGTTFRVYWPEIIVVPEHTGEIAIPAPAQHGTESVLIVEDEPVVRALIVRTVAGFGYYCVEAHDATEALRLLEEERGRIELVITDVVMPGMSGGQLGEVLAQHYPTLPVLYTSGFANDDVIRRGLLDASRPFLQKPFAPDDLARKIREVLEATTGLEHHAQSA